MRKWSLTALGVVFVIAIVYFRARAQPDSARAEPVVAAITYAHGALRATLVLPAGRVPSDVTLVAEDASRDFRAGPDGTFWMPDLVSGPCRLSVVDSGTDAGMPAWLPQEFCFEVEVGVGDTREIVLDLTQVPPCRIQGAVALGTRFHGVPSLLDDDRPAPTPRVFLGRGTPWEPDAAVRLDPEGHFLLGVSTPGRYGLLLELGFPELELKWVVRDEVELSTTPREWNLTVASGALRLLPPDPEHPLSDPVLGWRGEGERAIQLLYPLVEKTDGSVLYTHVPAGTVTLSIGRIGQQHTYSCEIRAGETTELRLAQ